MEKKIAEAFDYIDKLGLMVNPKHDELLLTQITVKDDNFYMHYCVNDCLHYSDGTDLGENMSGVRILLLKFLEGTKLGIDYYPWKSIRTVMYYENDHTTHEYGSVPEKFMMFDDVLESYIGWSDRLYICCTGMRIQKHDGYIEYDAPVLRIERYEPSNNYECKEYDGKFKGFFEVLCAAKHLHGIGEKGYGELLAPFL